MTADNSQPIVENSPELDLEKRDAEVLRLNGFPNIDVDVELEFLMENLKIQISNSQSSAEEKKTVQCLASKSPVRLSSEISDDRYRKFKECFRKAYDSAPKENDLADLKAVKDSISKQMGRATFSQKEIKAAFENLQKENACMIIDRHIILI
ncbi:DNA replication licensing factor [Ditylenchus destructor]|nr:DNA replication licensing factor [Ditylenchus destructor]